MIFQINREIFMALIIKDDAERVLYNKQKYLNKALEPLSTRQIRFIVNSISLAQPELGLQNIPNSNIKESLIQRMCHLDNLIDALDFYIAQMEANLLSELEFEWLKNDLRKQFFCFYTLYNNPNNHSFVNHDMQSIKESIDLYIDNLNIPIAYPTSPQQVTYTPAGLDLKSNILLCVKQAFHSIRDGDNYTKWLSKGDNTKIEWTKNYLQQNRFYLDKFYVDTDNIDVIRDITLASLDSMYLVYSIDNKVSCLTSDKTIFIERMKRAWSQKKFRDNGKAKNQYHLPLTRTTKARLEKLAEVKGLSTTAMLDVLINTAYERDCLGENGEELY